MSLSYDLPMHFCYAENTYPQIFFCQTAAKKLHSYDDNDDGL